MRALFVTLLLALTGCLGTPTPKNPMKKKATALVSSAAPAKPAAPPQAAPDDPPRLDLDLDKVELMKEMFLLQRDLNQQILKMAATLSEVELIELNQWMQQYDVHIEKKVHKPKNRRSRVF